MSLVSVVVPVYNDAAGLRITVESLLAQKCDCEYEIVIVDNGSNDETLSVACELAKSHPGMVLVVQELDTPSSYAARNTGIASGRGAVLGFIDADMTVGPNWIESMARLFESDSVDYVGFPVEVYVDTPSVPALFNRMTGFPMAEYVATGGFAGAGALAVRRRVFDSVGCFDPRLVSGGDREFGNRVRDAGFVLDYDPSVVMRHPARTTYRALFKKSMRIGRGIAQRRRLIPERYGNERLSFWRSMVPPAPAKYRRMYASSDVWKAASMVQRAAFVGLSWAEKIAMYLGYAAESGDRWIDRRAR